ncbi:MAG: hypothetical protein ABWX61_01875, partial [Paenisporosarcina sp.]
MAAFFRKRPLRYPLVVLSFIGVVGALMLMFWYVWAGILFAVAFGAATYAAWHTEKQSYLETEKHLETLSFRMKRVGEEALLEMPIGIILINDQFIIEWANPYMTRELEFDTLIGADLFSLSDELHTLVKQDDTKEWRNTEYHRWIYPRGVSDDRE